MKNFILKFKKWIIALFLGSAVLGAGLSGSQDVVVPIDKIHTTRGEIKIENTDENKNETFIIKSDKKSYGGNGNFNAIISVTNLREEEEGNLKLIYSKGEILNSVKKYIPVDKTIDVPIYSDVEVECELKASTTPCYEMIQTGTEKKDIIIDSWEDIKLENKTNKNNSLKKETKGKYDNKEIKCLFPKGTTFLKINIGYDSGLNFEDKFYIEIFGENGGYGLLDPLITDIVSYYKFDGDATDSAGSNDGTVDGATGTGSGKIDDAYSFDGGDVIDTNTQIINDANKSWTISFWANQTTSNGDNKSMISQSRISTYITNTTVTFQVYDGSWQRITKNISAGFNHIVAIYNDTTGKMRLLINNSAASDIDVGTALLLTEQTGIGNRTTGGDGFIGVIDEVGIWDRALTSDEITELYNSGDGLQYPFSSGAEFIPQILIY